MSKTTQTIMQSQQDEFTVQMQPVFDASTKAIPFHYQSMSGAECFEEPEHYDPELTRTMIRDMFSSAIMGVKDEEKKNTIMSWRNPLMEMNDTIMRMSDDLKADRDIISYPFDTAEALVKGIAKMNHDGVFHKSTVKGLNALMKLVMKRILMMNSWAFAIRNREDIKNTDKQAGIRATDDNGNIVYGITEKDEEAVHILNAMRGILTGVVLRLDPASKEYSKAMDKLYLLDVLVHATLEDKMDELERALKEKDLLNT